MAETEGLGVMRCPESRNDNLVRAEYRVWHPEIGTKVSRRHRGQRGILIVR